MEWNTESRKRPHIINKPHIYYQLIFDMFKDNLP